MQVEIQELDGNEEVPEFLHLTAEQLRSTKVAFVDHDDVFNCFYIDLNQQLQRICLAQPELKGEKAGEAWREVMEIRKELRKRDQGDKAIQAQIYQSKEHAQGHDAQIAEQQAIIDTQGKELAAKDKEIEKIKA